MPIKATNSEGMASRTGDVDLARNAFVAIQKALAVGADSLVTNESKR